MAPREKPSVPKRAAGSAAVSARPAAGGEVRLGTDWIERWLPDFAGDGLGLAAYLRLAEDAARASAEGRPSRSRTVEELGAALGPGADAARVEEAVAGLERRGMVEVVRKRGRDHFHLLLRDKAGVHRAGPQRPSIREALEFHKEMMRELVGLASQDDTPALRERYFGKYPALRDEYEFSVANRETSPDMPPFRLWMELSLYLMVRFEERYGLIKGEHAEVFKEASAQILRLELDMIDRLTRDVLDRKEEIFRVVGDGWIVGLRESEFLALPFVRELSRKYRVGAEQIFLNAIEALQAEGNVVVETDEKGQPTDLLLPSTTGLTEDEERLVFLHVEEFTTREIEELEKTLGRIRAAKTKYTGYLLERGVAVIVDLVRAGLVGDVDALLQVVVDRVNEQLDLVREDEEDPRVAAEPLKLAEALALYARLRRGGAPDPGGGGGAGESAPERGAKRSAPRGAKKGGAR